ncbi:hypothetical protein BHE74_00012670 [Ensete ventricosum]|nr:hypothetical protein BHE74_00012670 [Ensete ventricosum]
MPPNPTSSSSSAAEATLRVVDPPAVVSKKRSCAKNRPPSEKLELEPCLENSGEKMEQFLQRCFYHAGQYLAEPDKKLKEHGLVLVSIR